MDFVAVVDQTIALLRQRGRLTYRTLQLQFQLDDTHLQALIDELIEGQRLAMDEAGRVLVWTGSTATPVSPASPAFVHAPPPAASSPPEAERRQLTVLFCDLVGSTALSAQLDPEDLRAVVRAYQDTCAKVIARFAGHIAQYLGDGLLVYFGYPQAHEDDAQRAVRSGLGMIEAMQMVHTRLAQAHGVCLAVRLGIHTGLVVIGEVGSGGRQEHLALGETPNIAARLQELAAPDTVVISATTAHLIQGYFVCRPLGTQALKGLPQPLQVYRVLHESGAQTRLDVVPPRGLTPLVGRDEEVGLLRRRWDQATTGLGQVVLLSGEAGIGKSRLVQVLKEHVAATTATRWEWRCSPYYQRTALYPLIDFFHRALHWHGDETADTKLEILEHALRHYALPLDESVPLLAGLLSLPLPADRYPPLALSPQRQRQQTLDMLVAMVLELAAQRPMLLIVEDLHWVDPTTVEWLRLVVDQVPTTALCLLLTCRPEFQPPWGFRAYVTPLVLTRLPQTQAEVMLACVAGAKTLPAEVCQQVVARTDGVPLFVEELTKMVLESSLLRECEDRYELVGPLPPLAIPATLHASLMARLDRLAAVKEVAQLGATLGRTFAYALLRSVSPWPEEALQQALAQLVEAELLYQRGVPPQATYLFKHALIQEAAYQSSLKSRRQQIHQRIAQVLEAQFPHMTETQPELLAHHYTAAGLPAQAVPYWHQAGQRTMERSAHLEAISHLTTGLELLETLPDTLERRQQELAFQTTLGPVLIATKGWAAPEVEQAYARARALCQQVGDAAQLSSVLWGLWAFYLVRAELQTAHEVAEQCLTLAQRVHTPPLLLEAHIALAQTVFFWRGALGPAYTHVAQGVALYDPQQHHTHAFSYGQDPGMLSLVYGAWMQWMLGYPDTALARSQEALTLAHQQAHPFSLTYAVVFAAYLHQSRRDGPAAQAQAEAAMALATEQGFPEWLARAAILRGWALAAQGHAEEGIPQMCQGLTAYQTTGGKLVQTYYLAQLAEAYGYSGQADAGLRALAEAMAAVHHTGEGFWEAELHRLQGDLLVLQASSAAQTGEAEACLQRAIEVARRQQAKSLELRASMSLSRLWQQQGKRTEAHALLAPIYGWFTEGFDTADLQEAKALLEELAG